MSDNPVSSSADKGAAKKFAELGGPLADQLGRVEWIGLRPGRREEIVIVNQVEARPGSGLVGDRYSGNGDRAVTLIQAEHLPVMADLLGEAEIDPAKARRNLVVSGINLLALKDCRFRVGQAVLEMTGKCHPCSRMEETLGRGGYQAMRGHGGITARVVTGGAIGVGDVCQIVPDDEGD